MEGGNVTLTTAMLSATDEEENPADLVFTLLAPGPVGGKLWRNGAEELAPGDTFTQEELVNGAISFQDDGDATGTEGFKFELKAGADTIGDKFFEVRVTGTDEEPVLTNTGTQVDEGESVTLTDEMLHGEDEETDPSDVVFTVTNVTGGTLYLGTTPLNSSDTFTQADVDNGLVSFLDDGDATGDEGFSFTMTAGNHTISGEKFEVEVGPSDDSPELVVNNGADVAEGESVDLAASMLTASDEETDPSDVVFTVTGVTGGTLYRGNSPLGVGATFTQEELILGNVIRFEDDGDATGTEGFNFTVTAGADTLGSDFFEVRVTGSDDGPELLNKGADVVEGGNVTLTTAMLSATDEEENPADLVFTLLEPGPVGGKLWRNGAEELAPGDTFTQEELVNGAISFQDDGDATGTEGFNFELKAGADTIGPEFFEVRVTGTGEEPVLTNTGTQVDEGESVTLTDEMLHGEDEETDPSDVVFTVTNVTGGTLYLGTTPLNSSDTFTQADVDNGLVSFLDDGDATGDEGFSFTMTAGNHTISGEKFEVEVGPSDDSPVLVVNNGADVAEGESVDLAASMLTASDEETDPSDVVFTVTGVTGGTLYRGNSPLGVGATFTQEELILGNVIRFEDDGDATGTEGFNFTVTAGADTLGSDFFEVRVTGSDDGPELLNKGADVVEGGNVTLTTAMLSATDEEENPADLVFTLLAPGPVGGKLWRNGAEELSPGDTFTQEELVNGAISFQDDGDATGTEGFKFELKAGADTIGDKFFEVRVTGTGEEPVLTNTGTQVDEGESVTLTDEMLHGEDEETDPSDVVFTVTNVTGGTLYLGTTPLNSSDTFTQADVDNGLVSFLDDGDATGDEGFSFTMTAGNHTISGEKFEVEVGPSDDSPVLVVNNGADVAEGESVDLAASMLTASDEETDPSDVVFTVTGVTGGTLYRGNSPLGVGATFTQEELILGNVIRFEDDGDATGTEGFNFTVTAGADTLGSDFFEVRVTGSDDGPELLNKGADVVEGGNVTLTTAMLSATDEEENPADLVFTLLAPGPVGGKLWRNGAEELSPGDTFTQEELVNGAISFQDDGDATGTEGFKFELKAGADTIGDKFFEVRVTGTGEEPVLTNTGTQVDEGESVTLTDEMLHGEDEETDPSDVVFTVTNVTGGTLYLGTTPLNSSDTFTQADVDNGLVSFLDDGDATGDEGFSFTMTAGNHTISGEKFEVEVGPSDDSPELVVNNGADVAEGESVDLAASMLTASDEETDPSDVVFTVTGVTGGTLYRGNSPLGVGATFTQEELILGNVIRFEDDGDATGTEGFNFTVTAGADTLGSDFFEVRVTGSDDGPELLNKGADVVEGGNVTLTTAMLSATDEEENPADLVFTLLAPGPVGGKLWRNGAEELSPGDTFTQEELVNGAISFQDDGDATGTEGFKFELKAGADTIGDKFFEVRVTGTGEEPVLTNTGTQVDEGESVTLTDEMLHGEDEETDPSDVVFTVTNVTGGTLYLGTTPLNSSDTFTQADVDNGLVSFLDDGDATGDEGFSFTMTAGNHTISGEKFEVEVGPSDDSPELVVNNGADVAEGESVDLAASMLTASDEETDPSDVVFTVTGVTGGTLYRGNSPLGVGATFTQEELILGNVIRFEDDGDATGTEGFNFTVTAGADTLGSDFFEVRVTGSDDALELLNKGADVVEGGNVTLTTAMLSATDEEENPADLIFKLLAPGPVGGKLWRNGAEELAPGDIFTQEELVNGAISFQDDGDATGTEGFNFATASRTDTIGPEFFEVRVTGTDEEPVLTNTGTQVDEGESVTLTDEMLYGEDEETDPSDVVFTVTNVTGGTLYLGTTPLNSSDTFTQADVDNGLVSFLDDGDTTGDEGFSFTMIAGNRTISGEKFEVEVGPSDDSPVLVVNNGADVAEGESVDLEASMLTASYEETDPSDVVFTVTGVTGGTLYRGNSPLGVGATFTQEELILGNVIRFEDDGDATGTEGFNFTVTAGADTLGSDFFEVRVTGSDDGPELLNKGADVVEGGNVTLTTAMLSATDEEENPADLVFTLLAPGPVGGKLWRNGAEELAPGDTFTQEELVNGAISFQDDGDATGTEGFNFELKAGADTIGPEFFEVRVTGTGEEPVLTNTGTQVDEGESVTLTDEMLHGEDEETDPSDVVFTVTNVTGGTLYLGTTPLNSSDTFTQADVDNGLVSFLDDGDATGDEGFSFTMTAGNHTISGEKFEVEVGPSDDSPELVVNNGADVAEGESVDLAASMLTASDEETDPSDVVFTVTGVTGGTLYRGNSPLGVGATFTQEELILGNVIRFEDDGDATGTEGFNFTVTAGADTLGSDFFEVRVTGSDDGPELLNKGADVVEGGNVTLTTAMLSATDEEENPADLVFTLLAPGPVGGKLWRNGAEELSPGDTFTQEELVNGAISFQDDGDATGTEGFKFELKAGADTIGDKFFEVRVTGTGEEPVLTNTGTQVDEGESVTLTDEMLHGEDEETDPSDVVFTVTNVTGGTLYLGTTPLNSSDTFTQADVDNGLVSFLDDGDATGDEGFSFTMTAGNHTISGEKFEVEVGPSDDSPELVVNNGADVAEGESVDLAASMLTASDEETDPSDVVFTVTGVTGGTLYRGNSPLGVGATFTQEELILGNVIRFEDDGDATGTEGFNFTVTAGADTLGSDFFEVRVTGSDDGPELLNKGADVVEGGNVTLTTAMLSATDEEENPADLVFTLLAPGPVGGKLWRNGAEELSPGDTFTQEELVNGAISFQDDGDATGTEGFKFELKAGADTIGDKFFEVRVTGTGEEPVLTNTGTQVDEGESVTLTDEMLHGEDEETDPSDVVFTVTNVTGGTLYLGTTPLNSSDTFTQADVDNGLVSFLDDGDATGDEGFSFTMTAGNHTISGEKFEVEVGPSDDSPELVVNNGADVAEGESVDLAASMLTASDEETDPSDVVFTVTGVTGGTLYRGNSPLGVGATFTQEELILGNVIRFEDDGDATGTEGFNFTVTAGADTLGSDFFEVRVTGSDDGPELLNKGADVVEGGNVTLTTAMLSATDEEENPADLVFTLLAPGPVGGKLWRNGAEELSPGDTFTQEELVNGAISFQDDGDATGTEGFKFELKAGADTIGDKFFEVRVTGTDEEPVLTNTGTQVDEGESVTLTDEMLHGEDEETDPSDVVFTVTNVTGGTLYLGTTPLNSSDTFTQADVDNGLVSFLDDGDATGDEGFSFTMTAGNHTISGEKFEVEVGPSDDSPELVVNNGADVAEGESVDLAASMLTASDEETDPSDVVFTVTGVTGGTLYRGNSPLGVGSTFTQEEMILGNVIRFEDDGDATGTEGFNFTVTAGADTLGSDFFEVRVTGSDDGPRAAQQGGRRCRGWERDPDNSNAVGHG